MAIGATLFDSFASTTGFTAVFPTTNLKQTAVSTVYLVGMMRSSSSVVNTVPAVIAGWGITWQPLQQMFWQSGLRELAVWWGLSQPDPVAPSVLTFTYTGDPDTTGEAVLAYEMSGVSLVTPVVSSAQSFGFATTRTPTLTAYTSAQNAALAFFAASIAEATDMTAETNWTELSEITFASPATHLQAQFRANAGAVNDLGCTAAWDGTSINCAGAIVQLSPPLLSSGGDDEGLWYVPIDEAAYPW